ncbi:helicase-related protein [Candidatus Solincola tengchongensis]|uniref:helicase-related protein n=1 Tax=Candidatus Solincola tengchongensis TaxID=2900693 RepID=UPI00257A8602|nr:helicase-related protein [Candidatus Solincola tengchongensis]
MSETSFGVGSIVRCREREWVVVPSRQEGVIMLRPLSGAEEETCGVSVELMKYGVDTISSADFPLPSPEKAGDATSVSLLFDAARLILRDGAGPFRSLGKVSVRPRPYQFVPLLMALRLDPVRLLIADDVGVGKTIEAAVVARELIDRGEVSRLCVLCPPYLCEQWRKELAEKFHLDAVVVSSGTVSSLERRLPPGDHSVFGYYPYMVVSIDYAKSERHRHNFLANCPELVIVDEAHGAARPSVRSAAQQQRHALLREVAGNESRHLILLTATPHSGVEEGFLSLLGLLDPSFEELDVWHLSERERDRLARHFVQRRRADVVEWLGEKTPFPERIAEEADYELSPAYRELFEGIYEFSRELVASGETLTGWRRRIRYWTALALLRCVMSSPAAAVAAIGKRLKGLGEEGAESLSGEEGTDSLGEEYLPTIYETEDREPSDNQPSGIIEDGSDQLTDNEARRLRAFARQAEKLKGKDDNKMERCAGIIRDLLKEGYSPIVWCRYIATSDYVADELRHRLEKDYPDLRVVSITGVLPEEERKLKVEELSAHPRRVLVATDCLSEGVNLQEHFNAVVHYDLPWNPNRLEQREGRVDRFGQTREKVKAVLLYGRDNPVDGAVLEVLLRKARSIHKALGISVPVPADSETVMEAVLQSLFFRGKDAAQMQLFDAPQARDIVRLWDEAVEREKESRTRFAQRAIKPDEVDRELRETDSVLGDPDAVRGFVLEACRRMGVSVRPRRDGTVLLASTERLPEPVRETLPAGECRLCFEAPPPEDAIYVGRNHPFVTALARRLLEESLAGKPEALASRCGVMRTRKVDKRTVLLLLRCRYTLRLPEGRELLAEEVLPLAFTGTPPEVVWLPREDTLLLLREAKPDENVAPGERTEVLERALSWYQEMENEIGTILQERARSLQESHRRVREAARVVRRGLALTRHLPPDLLGVFVLLPVPKGVRG